MSSGGASKRPRLGLDRAAGGAAGPPPAASAAEALVSGGAPCPCIITDAQADWRAGQRWQDLAYFRTALPVAAREAQVQVGCSEDGTYSGAQLLRQVHRRSAADRSHVCDDRPTELARARCAAVPLCRRSGCGGAASPTGCSHRTAQRPADWAGSTCSSTLRRSRYYTDHVSLPTPPPLASASQPPRCSPRWLQTSRSQVLCRGARPGSRRTSGWPAGR